LQRPVAAIPIAAAILALGFVGGSWWAGSSGVSSDAVRTAILADPRIIPDAMAKLRSDEATAAVNRLRTSIERPFSGAWAGAADGDVTLVMFTDYACGFCRTSSADIERLLREDPRLKIVFRELPILSADSEAAARVALAAAQRGRYMPMHRALFQATRPDGAARLAAAERFETPSDNATLNSQVITRELQGNIGLARQLGFSGTPGWVVGNRTIDGAVGYDQLREAIAAARAS
jgi:protein-disulfide isomerase